jgi:WS/DGAT/MGAT family acyltransferase
MGAVDAVWLSMDSPDNLMVIEGIMTLEGPVDWERLNAVVQHRLVDRFPVFRQLVVEASNPMGMPHWEDDEDFSLEHHMHHVELPAPADEATLQTFIEGKMQEPLDRSRPLWHFYLIDGYQGGSVVVSRFHHALADGIALAEVLLSLTDQHEDDDLLPVDDPPPAPSRRELEAPPTSLLEVAERLVRPVTGPVSAGVRGALHMFGEIPAALHPSYAVEALTTAWQTGQIADKLLLGHNPPSPIIGAPGLGKRAVWSEPRPLVDIKLVGRTAGATVNDVLVGAVSAAISHYVAGRGGDPEDL